MAESDQTDEKLIELFRSESPDAWDRFVERYSSFIFKYLQKLGFDYDEAMDRFVFVLEKLADEDCRRLRKISSVGADSTLKPWLRTVIKNLSVSWVWSVNGRKRVLGFVQELPEIDQRIFQLYFWSGQSPFQVYESLRLEHFEVEDVVRVFESLEVIFEHLSQKKRWRLISNLIRARSGYSLDYKDETGRPFLEPVDNANVPADENFDMSQQVFKLGKVVSGLPQIEQLVLLLRYEEGLTFPQIHKALNLSEGEVERLHKRSIYGLRKQIQSD